MAKQRKVKRRRRPEPKTPIAQDFFIPNHSGDHSKGTVISTPINDTDIANKKYVDDNSGAGLWEVDGTETQLKIADEIDMQTKKIINVVDPTANQEASTKKYVDDQFPVTHASTTGQTIDDHHAKSHAHNGADGSGTVAHSDTTGKTANDHHNETHDIDSHTWADDWKIAYSNNTGLVQLSFNDDNGKFLMSNGEAALTWETAFTQSSDVDHDQTTNFVANKHINHTGVDITSGAGLTGGGDISSTRTLAVGAGTGITVNANDVQTNDGAINHDALSNWVANKHIDWTNASEDFDTSGEVKGTKQTVVCTLAILNVSNDAEIYLKTGEVTMTAAKGFCMPRAGSITDVSINWDVTADNNVVGVDLVVEKNGTNVWTNALNKAIGAAKEEYFNQARSTDAFAAGDTITVFLDVDITPLGNFTADEIIVTLTFYYDA